MGPTHLAAGAVQAVHLSPGAVGGDHVADGAIQGRHLADRSVERRHLAPGCVTPGLLAFHPVQAPGGRGPLLQQYGAVEFEVAPDQEQVSVEAGLDQPFAGDYVAVACTDNAAAYVAVTERGPATLIFAVVRNRIGGTLRGRVTWIAVGPAAAGGESAGKAGDQAAGRAAAQGWESASPGSRPGGPAEPGEPSEPGEPGEPGEPPAGARGHLTAALAGEPTAEPPGPAPGSSRADRPAQAAPTRREGRTARTRGGLRGRNGR